MREIAVISLLGRLAGFSSLGSLVPNKAWSSSRLSGVNPKIPCALIWTLPPFPVKALAAMSLFSSGTATMKPLGALIVILPPFPPACAMPAVADI